MVSNALLSRRTLLGGGLLLALAGGGIAAALALDEADATPLAQQAGDLIPISEALRIAADEAGGDPTELELERRDGRFVYEIEVGSSEVRIDGESGDVLGVEPDDEDDGDDDNRQPLQLPADVVEPAEAIATAEGEASGDADDIEIERRDGQLVYEVEVGDTEVVIDLATGEVVATEQDD